ncbi:MAG: pilus assembly protein TadG-related protein, partial [Acidimicrobiia bacterium]
MKRALTSRTRQAAGDETGAVLVLFSLLMVVMLGVAALLVDFGLQRVSAHEAQSVADLASLGAGVDLSNGSPAAACQD